MENRSLLSTLHNELKSMVRERQRIWQIMYQGNQLYSYRLTLSKGNLQTVLKGSEVVAGMVNDYLHDLNERITLLTGWVAYPETIPYSVRLSYSLQSKYFL